LIESSRRAIGWSFAADALMSLVGIVQSNVVNNLLVLDLLFLLASGRVDGALLWNSVVFHLLVNGSN
jgi:hypothetical protein